MFEEKSHYEQGYSKKVERRLRITWKVFSVCDVSPEYLRMSMSGTSPGYAAESPCPEDLQGIVPMHT